MEAMIHWFEHGQMKSRKMELPQAPAKKNSVFLEIEDGKTIEFKVTGVDWYYHFSQSVSIVIWLHKVR